MTIPYTRHDMAEEDIDSVIAALCSGSLTNGRYVADFEIAFRDYVGSDFALAVSSGTAALHLAVAAMQVPEGKTILVPSLTFAATANSALYCGALIEFVDIDPETYLVDIAAIEEKLAANPNKYAGVIIVDFAGMPFDVISLRQLCNKYGAWIIEDAAHALGAKLSTAEINEVVGASNYADITVFSFHPAKHITTGEGGMITTNDPIRYERMKLMRSHCIDKQDPTLAEEGWHYRIDQLGYNYRMSDINAALGISQLKRIDENIAKRQEIAKHYNGALTSIGISLPQTPGKHTHAYHLYVIQANQRAKLYNWLLSRGIQSQVHYVPLHMQPFYQKLTQGQQNSLEETEKYYEKCLSIPMFPELTDTEIDKVIKAIKAFS